MTEKKFEKSATIYREGDVPESAYYIVSGKVELLETVQGRERHIRMVEAGKTLGEYALFDPESLRPFTARAAEDSVLDALSPDEFAKLLEQCPKSLIPFLSVCLEKMRVTKVKEKSTMSGVAAGDISKITVAPKSEKLKEQMKPMDIPVGALPFRIGGYPEGGEVNRRGELHLSISSQANPLLVSRQHCEITLEAGGLIVQDLGSRFCTTVNGKTIGPGHGVYMAPLKKGMNEVALGLPTSPYQLTVKCE